MTLLTFPSEKRTYTDRVTGVTVHQLTDYMAHSYHLYFTNPGWWDGDRRLLFGSDRGNSGNLYSMELASGEMTRLTDNPPGEQGSFQNPSINPTRDEAYFWHGQQLIAIDLHTGEQRVLAEFPEGFGASGTNVTADGKYVCGVMRQHVDVGPVDLGAGYVGFHAIFHAHPLCRIFRVPTEGTHNQPEILHEEHNWIGHVNTSPTQAHLLTFCHEGPWVLVDQRMWVLDMNNGKVWKLRPQQPDEAVGHEYWMNDGVTIGYHGKRNDDAFYGFIRYDNSNQIEVPFPQDSNHFHSNTPELIVADGPAKGLTPYVLLCRFNGTSFEGPRVLCVHRGSRHIQHLHIHPRFTPDGKQVLFTADPRGYGQLFLAELPPFEELPTLDQITAQATEA
ncbi:MAG TPA: oligogalacturonate lyase family protein [Roseiflexaceae bacterium]|nr:oligogalacturonate lyase family protein [Roseiflexaceae bacterium]